ncbi:protein kinase C-binding protein NELL2-like isoform X2 [Brienomyrus brachyistius]|uniref:protein kinase C-binding protein NELL2-like isoform X2 n=1 Tax=Brienomyrus brachyistius TaxID=42636 RepID=UPI0020B40CC0|nr:protein kinase C-binding protein NELL2-like isoform X2 [Brienomyrus brachyistius]
MGLLQLSFVLCIFCIFSVLGFGVDPALRINLFNELRLGDAFAGVSQVQGFHNETRAFIFQDTARELKASEGVAEEILKKLRNRKEFTILATVKQEPLNSGVILSVHHAEQRFLELESSGHRNEIRLRYRTESQQPHTDIFPYTLADGRWHKVSVALSASHVLLHVDCNRIYEKVVEPPSMDLPEDTSIWLGQRNSAHGFFKGVMQDVELLVMPQGYISQCPDLNRTCPTCNDFHGLVQKIMELQDILAKTSSKLSKAEEKMNGLDRCYCERTCNVKGLLYREDESWTDGCKNCTCSNGTALCQPVSCSPPLCPPDSAPAYVNGRCCQECQPMCMFRKRVYMEGERQALRDSSGKCSLFECRDRTMRRVAPPTCPELNCVETDQLALADRCCSICRGHDFCAEGHNCMENSDCISLEEGPSCRCRDGFRALRDDEAYCEDIDECSSGFVECDSRAVCVNLPGWYHCECRDGYHDNGMFSANGESCEDIDECGTGRNSCANDTVCFNLEGGYDCRCPHGKNCTGDCIHDNRVKHNSQIWVLESDRCSVCSCQTGLVMCRRMVCDCENPTVDLFCCPECDPRLSSQCLHQNGLLAYSTGASWVESCQQCQCLQGEVDCWPLSCPPVDCEFTVVPEGECCPRCVADPCQADTIRNDITRTCTDEHGLVRFSGSSWIKRGTECTLCQCKNGHVCCSVDPMCL